MAQRRWPSARWRSPLVWLVACAMLFTSASSAVATPTPAAGGADHDGLPAFVRKHCAHASIRPTVVAPAPPAGMLVVSHGLARAEPAEPTQCQGITTASSPWVIVNKHRPLDPLDYAPAGLVIPEVRHHNGHRLRSDAAAAVATMFRAAQAAGVGQLSVESGYRSYDTQAQVYNARLRERGRAYADAWIARPGHSEHQSGLAVDIGPAGSSHLRIGGTEQGRWLAENSWRYGFILRYESGQTEVTGYRPEPWHFRFVGVALATDYHKGGWTSLEDYAGLPPAPTYAGSGVAA